jgi:hypothetical protein
MESTYFGVEGLTDEDRAYRGSQFSEVRSAIFANPYQKVWGGAGEPPLPVYEVTLGSVLRGILPFGRPYLFKQAVQRAVDSHADLRWGPDRKGFRRLLHPNGVCLTGMWEITEDSGYSGYFQKGSRALVVGRYSTCCTATRRGQTRSLALIGKLYPTTDPEHPEPLRTASFVVQQDFGGERTDTLRDAEMHSAPETRIWRRGLGAPILLLSGLVFGKVDKAPTMRQLYQIAELGKASDQPARAPAILRLQVASDQPRIAGDDLDFRDEVMGQIFDRGDPAPKRTFAFHLDVTDQASTHGVPGIESRTFGHWQRIGRLTFDNAVVSYNGDYVLHFNHPTWRTDRNDPATATRQNERKVR